MFNIIVAIQAPSQSIDGDFPREIARDALIRVVSVCHINSVKISLLRLYTE